MATSVLDFGSSFMAPEPDPLITIINSASDVRKNQAIHGSFMKVFCIVLKKGVGILLSADPSRKSPRS